MIKVLKCPKKKWFNCYQYIYLSFYFSNKMVKISFVIFMDFVLLILFKF